MKYRVIELDELPQEWNPDHANVFTVEVKRPDDAWQHFALIRTWEELLAAIWLVQDKPEHYRIAGRIPEAE